MRGSPVRKVKPAPSFFLKKQRLKEAGADAAILELKKYEALVAMANGKASKIIVPTDAVEMTKANVLFSETTGLGDVTPEAPEEPKKVKEDPCCD